MNGQGHSAYANLCLVLAATTTRHPSNTLARARASLLIDGLTTCHKTTSEVSSVNRVNSQ